MNSYIYEFNMYINSFNTFNSPFIHITITPKEWSTLESFYNNMMNIEKFWNMCNDIIVFI